MREKLGRWMRLLWRGLCLLFCLGVTLFFLQLAQLQQLTLIELRSQTAIFSQQEAALPATALPATQLPETGLVKSDAPLVATPSLPLRAEAAVYSSPQADLKIHLPSKDGCDGIVGTVMEPHKSEMSPSALSMVLSAQSIRARASLDAYAQMNPFKHPLWLLNQPHELLRRVWELDFYPAIPLTVSGLIYAIYGYFTSLLFIGLIKGIFCALFVRRSHAVQESTTS